MQNRKLRTLLIDNYDSFTFNVYQYLGELGANPIVFRNDKLTIEDVITLMPTHIIISPGPGTVENDEDFGICKTVLSHICNSESPLYKTPTLGICLGHQGVIKHFGGKISAAPEILHGKRSMVTITPDGRNSDIFKDIPTEFEAMRYHSLIGHLPPQAHIPALKITATTNDHIIMAVEHTSLPIYGIQFHPESIGTPEGKKILKNFLNV